MTLSASQRLRIADQIRTENLKRSQAGQPPLSAAEQADLEASFSQDIQDTQTTETALADIGMTRINKRGAKIISGKYKGMTPEAARAAALRDGIPDKKLSLEGTKEAPKPTPQPTQPPAKPEPAKPQPTPQSPSTPSSTLSSATPTQRPSIVGSVSGQAVNTAAPSPAPNPFRDGGYVGAAPPSRPMTPGTVYPPAPNPFRDGGYVGAAPPTRLPSPTAPQQPTTPPSLTPQAIADRAKTVGSYVDMGAAQSIQDAAKGIAGAQGTVQETQKLLPQSPLPNRVSSIVGDVTGQPAPIVNTPAAGLPDLRLPATGQPPSIVAGVSGRTSPMPPPQSAPYPGQTQAGRVRSIVAGVTGQDQPIVSKPAAGLPDLRLPTSRIVPQPKSTPRGRLSNLQRAIAIR